MYMYTHVHVLDALYNAVTHLFHMHTQEELEVLETEFEDEKKQVKELDEKLQVGYVESSRTNDLIGLTSHTGIRFLVQAHDSAQFLTTRPEGVSNYRRQT